MDMAALLLALETDKGSIVVHLVHSVAMQYEERIERLHAFAADRLLDKLLSSPAPNARLPCA